MLSHLSLFYWVRRTGLASAGLALLFVCLAVAPAGAAKARGKVYVATDLPKVTNIAVMPLKAPSDAGRALFTYLLIQDLRASGRYRILEPGNMSEELEIPELALAALTDEQAVEVGSLLGVDAVVLGTVGYFKGPDTAHGRTARADVGLRMLDCSSHKVVWSVALSESAPTVDVKLSNHADKVLAKMMAALEAKLPPGPNTPVEEPVKERPEVEVTVALDDQEEVTLTGPVFGATPQGVAVAESGLREVTLVWDKPRGRPHRYRVERALSIRGHYEALAEVSPRRRHYRDSDGPASSLADDTTYFYRVVAVRRDGVESRPSKPVEATTAPAPSPPAEVRARTPDARLVQLDWDASESEGVVEYHLERARADTPETFRTVSILSGTGFRDEGDEEVALEDDTAYLYRVFAVNRVGSRGEPSEPVAVTTLPIPEPVKNLEGVEGSVRSVPLDWILSPETNVVAYRVFRTGSEDGEFELLKVIGGRTNTRFLDGGSIPGNLPDNTTFYYMVRAVNSVGAESEPSTVVRATTRGIPPVVRHVTAKSGAPRETEVTWEESPDEKVMGYEVWRAVGKSDNFSLVAKTSRRSSTSYRDRGGTRRPDGLGLLLDGQVYRYKVLAFNTAEVRSEWSDVARAQTKSAPAVPHGLAATTEQPRRIELSWQANPETDIEHYLVEIRDRREARPQGFQQVEAEADTALVTFVDELEEDGRERFYRVKAVDADELESGWTALVQGQTKPAPESPKNLTAHTGDRSVRLTWDAPSQDDIAGYRIWSRVRLAWTLLDTTEQAEYELQEPEVARRNVIAVSAVDVDDLESARSAPVKTEKPLYR